MQRLTSMDVFIHYHAISLDTDIRFRLKKLDNEAEGWPTKL